MKSNRGSQILFLVIASVIVIMGVMYFAKSLMYSREQSAQLNESVIAESYAVELLEFLRSQTPEQLKANFAVNPIDSNLEPYKFCSHVNLLNRSDGIVLNEDPIARMPSTILDIGTSAKTKANRYYQVQVADIKGTAVSDTIQVNKDLCKNSAKEVFLNGNAKVGAETIELLPDERFILTVGVSWLQKDKTGENVKQVVLSSLIPEQKTP